MSRLFDLTSTPIEDGVTVVEASAGTGKTYCLVGLALRLLLERRVTDVSELLVVTFTRAATQELVARLRDALALTCRLLAGEETSDDPFFRHLTETYGGDGDGEALRIAREALVRFDEATVATIHGFCLRVLGDGAFESGEPFEGELVESAAPLLLEAARDVWRRLLYLPPARRRGRAAGIVAAVITEEGLTPESFLADFELARRHPRTEVLPPPADLDAATRHLGAAHQALAESWDTAAVRRLLEPRRFLRGGFFSGGVLRSRLRAVEAFCTAAEPSGLRAVLELAGERLEPALFKRDRAGVAKHPTVAACSAFAAAVARFRHALRCRFVTEVGRRFEADKRERRTWSYDDLLHRLRRALDDPRRGRALVRAVRGRYSAALIDEFQDTDLIQYQIFHRLFRRGPLVLIGDPKQAIYRFRGADVFAYLAARDGADRVYTLAHNWRTERPLVEAVNAVFSHPATRPFVFEQIAFEPAVAARRAELEGPDAGRPPLQWIWLPRPRTRELARAAIEDAVSGEIARLLNGRGGLGALAPDQVAVLVRTNEQAASLQSALRAARIPSVIGRSGDVLDSEEMAELETVLAAVADPGDGGRLRAACATRLWGAIDRDIRRANRDVEAAARQFESFRELRRDWRRRGFMPMIRRLLDERGVRLRLLGALAGERRLTNLLHAAEVLHRTEREGHLSPAALLGWLAAERGRQRPETDQTATLRADLELRLESDAAAVRIATVHRSKGLEYDVVFCPYLWQARPAAEQPVPAHAGSRLVLDYGSGDLELHRSQAEAERLSEEARLTYVALTRARRRCYLVWGDVPGRHGPAASALGYLLHRGGGRAAATPEAGGDERYRELGRLIAAHDGVMELRAAGEMAAPLEGRPARRRHAELRPRPFSGSVPRPWSLESFSSLSRPAHPEVVSIGGFSKGGNRAPPERPLPDRRGGADGVEWGMLAFARGRSAGSCLHRVLELCDLARLDDPETEEVIAESLRRFGLEEARRHVADRQPAGFDPAEAAREMLRRLAAAPLPGSGVALGAVARADRLVEWKFTMPLGRVTPRRLARVFRENGRGAIAGEYPARLEALGHTEVHGYLTGFVDLVFEHRGRWFLIDWKSNDLGPDSAAYDDQGMWQAMSHHHYVLQYHLYLLALHRFLSRRTRSYDYRHHVAGASYVFLRGLAPPSAVEAAATLPGWYLDRPPLALISALDELVGDRSQG